MKIDQLRLQPVADAAAWDAWVERSPQGTVFASHAFLQALGLPHERLAVLQGGQCLALLPVVTTADGGAMLRPPFTPHLGPLFLPPAQGGAAVLARQRIDDEFTLTEWLIGQLVQRYTRVELALAPGFDDLRPFLWHNYHDAAAGQFRVTPRYTARLAVADAATLRAQARACRRQEEKKAQAGTLVDPVPMDAFLELYERTFARQDLGVDAGQLHIVRRLAEQSLAGGWGRLAGCTTAAGELAAAALFVYDRRRAYYLFAANDPAHRNSGAATRLMFDHLDHARQRGVAEVDFVGVNSPARGDFKLSFNPALTPYFDLSWAAP